MIYSVGSIYKSFIHPVWYFAPHRVANTLVSIQFSIGKIPGIIF